MGAFRIFSRLADLLDVKTSRASTVLPFLKPDGSVEQRQAATSDVSGLQSALDAKQPTLVSGTNIKTVSGVSILGTGDLNPVTATNVAAVINSAAEKTTPANDDRLAITDSAASHALKKLTWANLKATLKTYLDGLYSALGHTHPWSEINKMGAVPSDVGAGTIATQDANNVAITGGTISGLTSLSTSGNTDLTGYLSAAGGTLYADHVTSRVGIGTNSPTAKLDVNGTFNAVGNATIGGTLTVTGQTADEPTSVMTRGLADARYSHTVADFDYDANTVGATGSGGVWTWTPPATAKLFRVTLVSGGAGGGSGRCGAAGTNRFGGGGGAPGVLTIIDIPVSYLPAGAWTITVGAGGAGGAAQSTPDSDGLTGSVGGETKIAIGSTLIAMALSAGSGTPGRGGTTTSGTGGSTSSHISTINPNALIGMIGGNGSSGNGDSRVGGPYCTGGGGGGGLNTSNNIGRGGVGTPTLAGYAYGSGISQTHPGAGVDGGTGGESNIVPRIPVSGGGVGGNGGFANPGGRGRDGVRGGGGGGGGAGTNGGASGAGGNGGNGFVRIEIIN
ncbi:MAG: hypothetical protein LLG20_22610 [Acidobacteriales bacterium]|nr:hypothetical protein [Terriglobales bacterium]